jgi:hypothetical protein
MLLMLNTSSSDHVKSDITVVSATRQVILRPLCPGYAYRCALSLMISENLQQIT